MKAFFDLLPQSLHKALTPCKYGSSVWWLPSILLLYHTVHKQHFESHSCGHTTHTCQRYKKVITQSCCRNRKLSSHINRVLGKTYYQEIQHCKVRRKTRILLCCTEETPECQSGGGKECRYQLASSRGYQVACCCYLNKVQERGQLAQLCTRFKKKV